MKPAAKNLIALIVAIIVGGLVNMGLVMLGPMVIPAPIGVNVTDIASIAASIHLFEPKHFIFPFLAHGIGTLAGAAIVFLTATSHTATLAYVVGGVFLLGGIANSFMIPAPPWYLVVDLLAAYIPMAWLGIRLGKRLKNE